MKTKKLSSKFVISSIGDHFVIKASNLVDMKKKVIKQVFSVDGNELTLRLTPETALKLAQHIDEALEDYDFDKRLQVSKKGA